MTDLGAQGQPPVALRLTPPETTQRSYAPIPAGVWHEAELILNSNSTEPRRILFTFYTAGAAVVGPEMLIQPAEAKFVRLSAIAPAGLDAHSVEAVELEYVGRPLEIGSQLTVLRGRLRGAADVPFSMQSDFKSTRLHAVWSGAHGRSIVTVANSSSVAVTVNLTRSDGANERFELAPHRTRTLTIVASSPGGPSPGAESRAEWLTIDSQGPPGSIRAAGFSEDQRGRFRSSIRFYDPSTAQKSSLFATNLRLDNKIPTLVLRNTSAEAVTVRPRYTSAGDQPATVDDEPITLAPRESRSVAMDALVRQALPLGLSRVSVALTTSGSVGAVVGSLQSLGDNGASYDVPLRDPGPPRQSTGSYPWRIDGDYNTVVTITNVSNTDGEFLAYLSYPGGAVPLPPGKLLSGQTAVFDVRTLRDRLPIGATTGQFRWSIVRSAGQTKLIGRAEISSEAEGRVSSYSCAQCCGWNSWSGLFVPGSLPVNYGGVGDAQVLETFMDCYGGQTPAFAAFADWWDNSNTVVTTVWTHNWGAAKAYGNDGGQASVAGHWPGDAWFHQWDPVDPNNFICIYQPYTQTASGLVQVREPTSIVKVVASYTDPPPAPYDFLVTYQVLDQNGSPMGAGLNFSESYSALQGNGTNPMCFTQLEIGGGPTYGSGFFDDLYYLHGGPPNPCYTRSVQTQRIDGRTLATREVVWRFDGVTVQGAPPN